MSEPSDIADLDCMNSDYYANYTGPALVSVIVNGINDTNLYESMLKLYGQNNNWDGKCYLILAQQQVIV